MIDDLSERLQEAVQAFWDARDRQQKKQVEAGKIDAGSRGNATYRELILFAGVTVGAGRRLG